jgi:hypothetical protein
MTKKQAIQLFQKRKVRTVWDDEQEEWYFCVVDKGWGQIVTPPFTTNL